MTATINRDKALRHDKLSVARDPKKGRRDTCAFVNDDYFQASTHGLSDAVM